MSERTLGGSCLCGAVRYEVETPFARFAHCYCSRCRKTSGAGRSSNLVVAPGQLHWISGSELVRRYDLPSAQSFATAVCGRCGGPVPHLTRSGREAIVPAGSLDDEPPEGPALHAHWASRADWVADDESHLPRWDGDVRDAEPPPAVPPSGAPSMAIRLLYWGIGAPSLFLAIAYSGGVLLMLLAAIVPPSRYSSGVLVACGLLVHLAAANCAWSGWRLVKGVTGPPAIRPFPRSVWLAAGLLGALLGILAPPRP